MHDALWAVFRTSKRIVKDWIKIPKDWTAETLTKGTRVMKSWIITNTRWIEEIYVKKKSNLMHILRMIFWYFIFLD